MAVVSVSTETDTTTSNRKLPTREQSVHESCLIPSLSSTARRRVRLLILEPGCVSAADQRVVLTETGWRTENRVKTTSRSARAQR
jgi:hypothetical protein